MRVDRTTDRGRRRPGGPERLTGAGQSVRVEHGSAPAGGPESRDQPEPKGNSTRRALGTTLEQPVGGGPALPAWLRRLGSYVLALLLVAAAMLVRMGLTHLVGPGLPLYLTFYPVVMLVALVGGWGPGLLATLAAAVVAEYWLLPPPGLKIESPVDAVGLLFFSIVGVFMSVVAELYRRIRGRLEELVLLRTKALNQANEQLQTQAQELTVLARSLAGEKKVLQAVMDGAWNSHLAYLDRDFNFVRVNEAYARTCGYTPEGMIGKNHFALYPHAENEAIFARVRDTGVPFEVHDRPFVFPDQPQRGTTYWDWTLAPIKNDDGAVEGLVLSLFETTQRKQAEEALRESEERFHRLFQEDLTGNFLSTPEGRILLCNPAFADIFGFSSADEAVGTSVLELYPDPGERGLVLARLREQGMLVHYEARRKRRDGTPIHVVENLVGHRDEQGELYEVQGYLFDDTRRKRAEEALREWNANLESKVAQRTEELEHRARQLQKLTLELTEAEERERQRLAEILHDDLQQVLAAARFQVGLLGSRVKNDAESAEMAGQARELLTGAIAKSRSLSHELSTPALSQSNLREAFAWLAEQMQKKHGLVVRVEMKEQIKVESEPLRVLLYKAAQELLFNVVKHAGVQEATLRLRRRRGRLWLAVRDRGQGFHAAPADQALGFGLLSIRERVEFLGGRLKIRSVPGRGSLFLLVLPDPGV